MTISLSTNVSRKDIEYGEITDATTSLAPGKYTIGELTGPLEIATHSLGNRSSVYIVDPLGITNTHIVTLRFGDANTEIRYTDEDGVSQVEAMPIIINNGNADFTLVRIGDHFVLEQDDIRDDQSALEALVQFNDNRYKEHLANLHGQVNSHAILSGLQDFSTDEPEAIEANIGNFYWNDGAGAGDSTGAFYLSTLYEMVKDADTGDIALKYSDPRGYTLSSMTSRTMSINR